MRDIPLSVVFSFPLPNFTHPETRGHALVVVNAIFISLVIIAVALRFYTRIFIKRWLGSDDYLIALSLIATVGLTAIVILANERYGWNRHIWDVPPWLIPAAGKIAFAAKIMFTAAATFTRMSLLCFYHRLSKDSGVRWFRWVIYASMAFVVIVGIVFVALSVWQCHPVKAYWDFPPRPEYRCMDEGAVTLGAGVVNCFADLLVTLLPIPLILKLQMPLRQRVGVIVLLCLGIVVTIAGIVRTYYIWKSLVSTYDETWYSYPLWIAAAVEIDLGVICACAPALRPLLVRYVGPHASRFTQTLSEKFTNFSRPSSRRPTPQISPNNSRGTQHSKEAPSIRLKPLPIMPTDVELMGRAQSVEPLVTYLGKEFYDEGKTENMNVNVNVNELKGEESSLASTRMITPSPISTNSMHRQYQSVDRWSEQFLGNRSTSTGVTRTTPRGIDIIEHRDQLVRGYSGTRDQRYPVASTDVEAQIPR